MPLNDDLQTAFIRHQIYTLRLAGGTGHKLVSLLNRVDDDIVNKIINRAPDSGEWTTKRLQSLLNDIREINQEVYKNTNSVISDELINIAQYETEFTLKKLSDLAQVELNIIRPPLPLLRSAVHSRPFQGRLLKEWFTDLEQSRFKQLRDAIRIGVIEGESIQQIIQRIRGTRALNYRDGILETGRRQIEAVTRTAVNHTVNAARNELYSANTDAIKGVKWVSTLDGRTTPICQARDGQVYGVDKGPRPPAHINCRSTTTPVIKSWKELGIPLNESPEGTRASINGQVPESETYNEWLKKQSPEFQDDVLGKTKGKLFRNGGLTVDSFVDKKGSVYTLDELKAKERQAFDKAGIEM